MVRLVCGRGCCSCWCCVGVVIGVDAVCLCDVADIGLGCVDSVGVVGGVDVYDGDDDVWWRCCWCC